MCWRSCSIQSRNMQGGGGDERRTVPEGHSRCPEGHSRCSDGHFRCSEGHSRCPEGHSHCSDGHFRCSEGHSRCSNGHFRCPEEREGGRAKGSAAPDAAVPALCEEAKATMPSSKCGIRFRPHRAAVPAPMRGRFPRAGPDRRRRSGRPGWRLEGGAGGMRKTSPIPKISSFAGRRRQRHPSAPGWW